jgi:predicted dehydrogenase
MAENLKLAMVGCGVIARFHLDGIKESAPRIQVTAAIDPQSERAAEIASETGADSYASLEEALDKGDFDAVDIMVPHDMHEQTATAALAAGKHVLMEKPMATELDACDRVLAAAEKAGVVFMIAENSQYWPEIVKARDLIQDGAIGDVISARANFAFEFDPRWFTEAKPWRYEKSRTGGGIVIDGGSHWIRPLRMWMGEIDEIVGEIGHPLKEMEGESFARALIRFQSGKIGVLEAIMAETVMAPDCWWKITGEKGEISVTGGIDEPGEIKIYDADSRDGRSVMTPAGYRKSFGPELDDFSRAVLDGKAPEASAEHSLGELRTALALYRSAETRRWEKVWE